MLYDNLYALGHIFQMFLQDTPERLDHGEDVLSRGDASYASADATLGSHLLEWLAKKDIVMDAAHKATLLQIANACEALADGRTFQCGEGWHSNEKTVRFWHPSPRVPKETAARCYAYTTPYTTMIPLCNVY